MGFDPKKSSGGNYTNYANPYSRSPQSAPSGKNGKGLVVAVVILILFMVIGAGAYMISNQNKPSNQNGTVTTNTTQATQLKEIELVDDSSSASKTKQ